MKATNAITTINETKSPIVADMMADIGISTSDLVIPRLMLMQNTSELVGDDKASLGDIVNSQTIEVVGGLNQPVEIVPLKMYKSWRIYDMSNKQPQYVRMEPVTADNDNLPWEFSEDGKPHRRIKNFNFFVLLKSELEAGEAFPAVISFKSTSLNAGKQLATAMFKLAAFGKAPYAQSQMLCARKEKKDTNTYAVLEIRKGSSVSTEMQEAARGWLNTLRTHGHSVQDGDDETVKNGSAPKVQGSDSDDLF